MDMGFECRGGEREEVEEEERGSGFLTARP